MTPAKLDRPTVRLSSVVRQGREIRQPSTWATS
jgi:hypothetical protein